MRAFRSAARSAAKGAVTDSIPGGIAARLARLGLHTDLDLALHLPLRYEDETRITPLADAREGETVQVEASVVEAAIQYRPHRQLVVCVAQSHDPGAGDTLTLRFLNFYGSQVKQLAPGTRVRARGELRGGFLGREMVHPHYSVVHADTPLPDRLTPVYPGGAGLGQKALSGAIAAALERVDLAETLPAEICQRHQLLAIETALRILHRPPADASTAALRDRSHAAWIRVKFDELLAQQLSLARAHAARRLRSAPVLAEGGPLVSAFVARLPFTLTRAQQRVLREIASDLRTPHPMQRLLQGDVGSGKTVVAALAALQAVDAGYQAALMAPTEILAEQHFRTLSEWIAALGVEVAWLTGSLKKKGKDAARLAIESGAARLAIGTHALIQDDVNFERLGLAIVDEQHRFGVGQRLALRAKARGQRRNETAMQPHQLMMSATPIPRTLAMTYFADLDVSTIDEMPPGRKPITTKLFGESRRDEVLARVRAALAAGRQAYWVCPLVEESEALQLQTAVDTHATLAAALPEACIGLVHGRLAGADKAAVMHAFAEGAIALLVATTVIEVGVDVPNASLMVIEHAERFGLAQLHQLRGRIGRGSAASACILLYQTPLSASARERLKTMRETQDGFTIARRDLELRGPGEFLGHLQSGDALLRFADLQTDQWLVEAARAAAARMLAEFPQHVDAHLARWMGGREDFLRA